MLPTIRRALSFLGCDLGETDVMASMRLKYQDMWAYADVIANMIRGKEDYAPVPSDLDDLTDSCVLTFKLLFQMDEGDTIQIIEHFIHSCSDRKSIVNAVIGELRKARLLNAPNTSYVFKINFHNRSGDPSAPTSAKVFFRDGRWFLMMDDQPKMAADGYGCVTEDELKYSVWHLDGWRKDDASTAALQADVELGHTRATMFFQSHYLSNPSKRITFPYIHRIHNEAEDSATAVDLY